jgi:ELWxxDGT repeat protein
MPGAPSSTPYALCYSGNNFVYFSAHAPEGEELYVADLVAGTLGIAMDIWKGDGSSEPYGTTRVNGSEVVFTAEDGVHGRELWIISVQGEVAMAVDIFSDGVQNPSSYPAQLTPLGKRLFFVADDVSQGRELWVWDGETATCVKDIFPGQAGSYPDHLTVVGEKLYFSAESPEFGRRLWVTDGTAAGTGRGQGDPVIPSSAPKHLFVFGDTLLLSAYTDRYGEELFGVLPNRRLEQIKNINPDEASSYPQGFVIWGAHVYFQADDGTNGAELWRTDGTEGGTVRVRDLAPVPYKAPRVSELRVTDTGLVVAGWRSERGDELYQYRTPDAPPVLLDDIARPFWFSR